MAKREMAQVRNACLTPQEKEDSEERTRVCLDLSDNFNEAISFKRTDTLRSIAIHRVGNLPELDLAELPVSLVSDIERALMERVELIVEAIAEYQTTDFQLK